MAPTDPIAAAQAALSSGDPAARRSAAEHLAQSGTAAAPAAVALARACADADDQVREWVVAALEELGPPGPGVVGDLVALLTGPDPLPAYWAATLLGRLGESASAAVPVLATTLAGAADLAVRERCAWALGKIGPAAAAARDVLRHSVAGTDERLARLASEALAAIGG